jgi:RNA-directed DNA polymerase
MASAVTATQMSVAQTDLGLFKAVYSAWQQCARRKRSTSHAQRFELNLLEHLVDISCNLKQANWHPAPPVSFILKQSKARQIHAAEFYDRVVHHYLVAPLSLIYEPIFIHDLFSNRKGRGTHGAKQRLTKFMRQLRSAERAKAAVHKCEALPGHYLQLDIKNFFNSIDKVILFKLLQQRLARAVRNKKLDSALAAHYRDLCHTILKQDAAAEAIQISPKHQLKRVPAHKRLGYAGPSKGLAIGNLSSQFFANVYMNELDQFIKHQLKCKHYLRYVDDFVLLHQDPAQLIIWRNQIQYFLSEQLALNLRDQGKIAPVSNGIDFLGYIIRPDYSLVRKRVVNNLQKKLRLWQAQHIKGSAKAGWRLSCTAEHFAALAATLASYQGHFKHAKHFRMLHAIAYKKFPWLLLLFDFQPSAGQSLSYLFKPAIAPGSVNSYQGQCQWFAWRFTNASISVQKGYKTEQITAIGLASNARQKSTPWPHLISNFKHADATFKRTYTSQPTFNDSVKTLRESVSWVRVREHGYLKNGLKKRVIAELQINPGAALISAHIQNNSTNSSN